MATVIAIEQSWSRTDSANPGSLRISHAYAKLDCGHAAEVQLRPAEIACRVCGHTGPFVEATAAERPSWAKVWRVCSACRSASGGAYTLIPDPHNPEHRLTKVGDVVDCAYCRQYATALEQLRQLDRGLLAHARYRDWCGRGSYYIYRRDPSSPTGVALVLTIEARPEADEVLRAMGLSPLSPTEGLAGAR